MQELEVSMEGKQIELMRVIEFPKNRQFEVKKRNEKQSKVIDIEELISLIS